MDYQKRKYVHKPSAIYSLKENKLKCSEKIRFEHILTRKNLHSHDIRAAISRKFEVSATGNDGEGDDNDNWII